MTINQYPGPTNDGAVWQALMNATHESLVLIDSTGTVLMSNETGARRLGLTVEEMVGTCLYDHFPPDVAATRKREWDKVFSTGKPVHFQDARNERHFELFCYPVLTNGTVVSQAAIFARDITDSKNAGEQLRKERETFFSTLEKAPYGIFANDQEGNFTVINPEATNITGYTREDTPTGSDWFAKAYPNRNYRKNVIDTWKHDVTTRGIDRTFFVHCKDRSVKEVEFRAAKLADGTSITMFSDTTEKNRAKRQLAKSEEKYRGIFENAIMGIFQTTPDGRYLSINPAGARMYGYDSAKEMIATVTDLARQLYVDPHERKLLMELVGKNDIVEGFEAEHYRKDGSKIWTSINIRAHRNRQGKILRFDTTIEDITERKRLESRLIQAEKMQALGTLSGGIAHDFNNILTVLQGYGSLLQRNMDRSDPLIMYVDQILSASQKAASLTQSLLAFSRQQPITLNPINIVEAIQKTEHLLKRLVTDDVELKTTYPGEEIVVRADPTQIDQILFNLAANARDAMKNGGTLAIAITAIDADAEFARAQGFGEPGMYALISISDTGCGMDETTRAKIFEPFFTTKEVGKGTGLGLSTVYGIVKQHDGHITLTSEPGRGTTFNLYLPAVKTHAAHTREEPAMPDLTGSETVLVAEDNEDVRGLITSILTEHGYGVIEAQDGTEAIEKFKQNPGISLLILDSVMPKKNGREVYEKIDGLAPGIKVIFTSGYTKDIVLDKGIRGRDLEFVAKPLKPVDLLQKIREVLDR